MKLLCLLLGLAAAPAARAQTTPPPAAPAPRNPSPAQAKVIKARTAERRADNYQGPRVVKDGKVLGRKFIRDSKPAAPSQVAPTKE